MRRLALLAAILVVGTGSPRSVFAAPADDSESAAQRRGDIERAAKELDDPSFDVRRGAERALEAAGSAALDAVGSGEDAAVGRARLDALVLALEEKAKGTSPTAAAAGARLLRRLEVVATDDQVRGIPRLLRVRLMRLLGQCALPKEQGSRSRTGESRFFFPDRDSAAAQAVYGFYPEAVPVLRDFVLTGKDPRRLAGAIAILSGEDQGGADDETLTAIVKRFDADPEPLLGTAPYQGTDRTLPLATVGLALALAGRVTLLSGRLSAPLGEGGLQAVLESLPVRLSARGSGDLCRGSFLTEAVGGTVTAADAIEAARRSTALDQPWLARMQARRALFLDPGALEARKILVEVDLSLALGATARIDAAGAGGAGGAAGEVAVPADAPAEDAAAARELDDALRTGSLGQRLAYRIEAGSTQRLGVTPVALGAGILAYGKPGGRLVAADPGTGGDLASVYTGTNLLPRSVAISGRTLAAVSGLGRLFLWTIGERQEGHELLTVVAEASGPFLSVASGPEGTFFLASGGRGLWLAKSDGKAPERFGKVASAKRPPPVSLDLLSDGSLLWGGPAAAERIDPATGEVRPVVAGLAGLHVAPYGTDALAAADTGWRRISPDGRVVSDGTAPDESQIDGIAGDPASGTIYLTLASEVVAISAADGAILWREPVEGSGNAVLGPGLIVVPAGAGDSRGGGREDRTLSVLRTAQAGSEIFGKQARTKVLAAAIAALSDGRPGVATLLVDPLPMDAVERAEFQRAVERASGATKPVSGPDGDPAGK